MAHISNDTRNAFLYVNASSTRCTCASLFIHGNLETSLEAFPFSSYPNAHYYPSRWLYCDKTVRCFEQFHSEHTHYAREITFSGSPVTTPLLIRWMESFVNCVKNSSHFFSPSFTNEKREIQFKFRASGLRNMFTYNRAWNTFGLLRKLVHQRVGECFLHIDFTRKTTYSWSSITINNTCSFLFSQSTNRFR